MSKKNENVSLGAESLIGNIYILATMINRTKSGRMFAMDIDLSKLEYSFVNKPLLIGGKAKEYYGIRKSGLDTDLVVMQEDYENLAKVYPQNKIDFGGDLGIKLHGFEI